MLTAPFPYFGGKSRAADLIWSRFGIDCGNYVEPFFGSGAVLLNRPEAFSGWMTVNDLDGLLANLWRSMKYAPNMVADAACSPVNEADLHARHLWLVTNRERITSRLMADPYYHEPEAAGWWAWGACSWIGGGWCAGDGPWHAVLDSDGVPSLTIGNGGRGVNRPLPHLSDGGQGVNRPLPHLSDGGQGVNRKLPHLGNGGRGVNRPLPHLSDGGQGVNRKLPHLGDGGQGVKRPLPHLSGGSGVNRQFPAIGNAAGVLHRNHPKKLEWLQEWFADLQEKLQDVRVCCGDWSRIMSIGTMTRNGTAAVLLDPPYSLTGAVYAQDSSTVSGDVREWCKANGDNQALRIALCGHDTEHNDLEQMGWSVETWNKAGGYQGKDDRERIWFSPHCLGVTEPDQMSLFA